MIMSGQKLEEFGRALYGDIWLSTLARKLKRSKRTILRWRNGDAGLSKELQLALIDLIDERFAVLGEKREQLAKTFDDV